VWQALGIVPGVVLPAQRKGGDAAEAGAVERSSLYVQTLQKQVAVGQQRLERAAFESQVSVEVVAPQHSPPAPPVPAAPVWPPRGRAAP
jgi:hypothetical protein